MSGYQLTISLIYLCLIVRAAVVSKDMVATTKWMVGSLVITWLVAYAGCMIAAGRGSAHDRIGAAAADFFFIPSFIVPAIVGSIHARHTQKVNRTGQAD